MQCWSGGALLKSWHSWNLKQENHRSLAVLCSTDPGEVGYRDSDEILQVKTLMPIIILTQGISASRELL